MEAYKTFIASLKEVHESPDLYPKSSDVEVFVSSFFDLLFRNAAGEQQADVESSLNLTFAYLTACLLPSTLGEDNNLNNVLTGLRSRLPALYSRLLLDAAAIEKGDPAAISTKEVIHTYPGFLAISYYRLAHELAQENVVILPRMITEIAHSKTGIDIHPKATIGESFFIDHGTGIVIGETTQIGSHVKVYQGVTLGALSVEKEFASTKRHPTIENGVVIYAGATILGGGTIIGENSIIGGNTWITQSVPSNSRVTHTSEITIKSRSSYV